MGLGVFNMLDIQFTEWQIVIGKLTITVLIAAALCFFYWSCPAMSEVVVNGVV